MEPNPYEAPASGGREPNKECPPSRLASASLTLGFAFWLTSWTALFLCSPIGVGELIHHMGVGGNIALSVLNWVVIVASFIGPVPTGIALSSNWSVVRVRGVLLLLAQTPLLLSVVHWMIFKVIMEGHL
jgi:hypothetical protein